MTIADSVHLTVLKAEMGTTHRSMSYEYPSSAGDSTTLGVPVHCDLVDQSGHRRVTISARQSA
jgi:hypothetical protein